MSTREERIAVFKDTLDWVQSDQDLAVSIAVAKVKTEIFYEDDYPEFGGEMNRNTKITVTGNRSFQAAMRLQRENPEARIAVMNFANAFHAGGGVTNGASA